MIKECLLKLMAGVLILAFVSKTAQAGPITGGIQISGYVTSYVSTNGTGTSATAYTQAHSLSFRSCVVAGHSTGSFVGVSNGTAVTMFNPLVINPAVAPTDALWSVGNLSFHATSISTVSVGTSSLFLKGVGVFSDGTPADSTLGSWTAMFTLVSYNAGSDVTDPPPSLKITTDGSNAIISWPTNSIGFSFSVQTCTNAAVPANWVTLTNLPVLVSNQMVVTNPISSGGQMFRLIH